MPPWAVIQGKDIIPKSGGGKMWKSPMAEASLLCYNESERENTLLEGRKQHV